MRVGHGNPVGIDGGFRLDAELLHIAVGERDVDGLGFPGGRGRGLVGLRNQRAVDDAALRGSGAGAVGDGFQNTRGAAEGRGGIGIVADFDIPGAAADRDAGERGLILRFQPPLRGG